MEVCELSLPVPNPLVHDYINNQLKMEHFFDYNPHQKEVFQKRYDELQSRKFDREQLVQFLLSYHKRFENIDKTIENIEKLRDPKSVVVVGGQQAGLLTGPLYTIHKVISILHLAKQKEEELNVPVIPVFWIAGEDHDFEEINHVYVVKNGKIQKKSISQVSMRKKMVSCISIDKVLCHKWIDDVFETFGETEHTKPLLEELHLLLERSNTYVEFFEELLLSLFRDEGLVLINSGSSELRHLEKNYFRRLIYDSDKIYEAVRKQQMFIQECSFKPVIEMKPKSSNLFFEYDEERFILLIQDNNQYYIPEIDLLVSKDELLKKLEKSPQLFSNNVVTRPIMQEYLLPTLAFIAGPGEIAYWAELKEAFHVCGLNMPPVVPRLNITILERHIETDLQDLELSFFDLFHSNVQSLKERWLKEKELFSFEPIADRAKEEIKKVHQTIQQAALEIDRGLEPLLQKNAHFIEAQIDFINQAVQRKICERYEVELKKFQRIEYSLTPNGSPQERVWNIYYYLNKYGRNFLKYLQQQTYICNGNHKVVKI